jgi:hypothetical protein
MGRGWVAVITVLVQCTGAGAEFGGKEGALVTLEQTTALTSAELEVQQDAELKAVRAELKVLREQNAKLVVDNANLVAGHGQSAPADGKMAYASIDMAWATAARSDTFRGRVSERAGTGQLVANPVPVVSLVGARGSSGTGGEGVTSEPAASPLTALASETTAGPTGGTTAGPMASTLLDNNLTRAISTHRATLNRLGTLPSATRAENCRRVAILASDALPPLQQAMSDLAERSCTGYITLVPFISDLFNSNEAEPSTPTLVANWLYYANGIAESSRPEDFSPVLIVCGSKGDLRQCLSKFPSEFPFVDVECAFSADKPEVFANIAVGMGIPVMVSEPTTIFVRSPAGSLIHDGRTFQSTGTARQCMFFLPGAHIGNGFWTTAGFPIAAVSQQLAEGASLENLIDQSASVSFNFSSPTTFQTLDGVQGAGFQYMDSSVFASGKDLAYNLQMDDEYTHDGKHEGGCCVVACARCCMNMCS